MSKPAVNSFFVGRALAEGLYEQLGNSLTNALSELGKFDAEQKEHLRSFTQQVMERAAQEVATVVSDSNFPSSNSEPVDLQATIDELRAEVAQLRSELQQYRNRTV
jgi:polyhydroxyalkanoate synthesis regulator phasin